MIDWNKPIETAEGKPARLVYVKPHSDAALRRVIAVLPGTSAEYIITDSECTTYFRNVPEPGAQWTPISVPPGDSRTVLLTSSSQDELGDDTFGPPGSLCKVWTGFWHTMDVWSENRCEDRGNQKAKFWRNLPA